MGKKRILEFKKSFFALLGILLTTVIILILYFAATSFYFKKYPVDKENQKLSSDYGINTSSYQKILESTTDKIKEFNKEIVNRTDDAFDKE